MSRFLDGPVEGAELTHRRAPIFLRVVRHRATGKVDVLDQLEDTPSADESMFVYKAASEVCHMCVRPGGCFEGRNYRWLDLDLATVEALRENGNWRDWCEAQGPLVSLAAS